MIPSLAALHQLTRLTDTLGEVICDVQLLDMAGVVDTIARMHHLHTILLYNCSLTQSQQFELRNMLPRLQRLIVLTKFSPGSHYL